MSKVLLIKPRFIGLEFPLITQPLGLMYIGSMLKAAGHEPKIHDCALDHKDLHALRRILQEWPPDFIGVSIIITEVEETKKIMELIRAIYPEIPVTFGGPWPSANPEKSIMEFGADFVVMGEGELVFPELIDAINRKLPTDSIAGTASWCDGHVKINPGRLLTEEELNQLPFPAWELLDHKMYAKMHSKPAVGRRPYMAMITSRGCPYRCSYCYQIMGKTFRKRSARSVLAEMEELYFQYGLKEFEIIDDCFNLDRERMIAILTSISNKFDDVKLHFPNGLRADLLEPRDMALLKQAGTVSAAFAIETASPRLQKMIHKHLDIEKADLTINASAQAGIYSTGFFMLGFPTETYEEASSTVQYAVRSSLHRAIFLRVIPFPGTELADMVADTLKNKHKIDDAPNMNYYNNSYNVSVMSDKELSKIFQRAYRAFYFNPRRILSIAIHHPKFIVLPYYAFLTMIRALPRMRHRALVRN